MDDAALRTCSLSSWYGDPKTCRWCARSLTGRQQRWCSQLCVRRMSDNHFWTNARRAAVDRDQGCSDCGAVKRLEVNHIVPRNGQGYGRGCHHHLDNLATLCHSCHVEVTKAQRRLTRSVA